MSKLSDRMDALEKYFKESVERTNDLMDFYYESSINKIIYTNRLSALSEEVLSIKKQLDLFSNSHKRINKSSKNNPKKKE